MVTQLRSNVFRPTQGEWGETIDSEATEKYSNDVQMLTTISTIDLCIRRKTGTGRFKIQTTASPTDEIKAETAEWFDWDIPEADVSGWVDENEIHRWLPIPGAIRLVIEAGVGTSVYWSMRAN